MTTLAVFCSSSAMIDRSYLDLAARVGAGIARRGWSLVTGGGSVSCMGAVARAARAGGARTVGVIPRGLLRYELADSDADELVVTADMRSRKAEMDRRSDGFLALPGGLGTLEELLEVWVARTLGMHTKPVVAVDPDGTYRPARELVDALVLRGFVLPGARDELAWASDAEQALDLLAEGLSEPAVPTVTAPGAAQAAARVLGR